MKKIFLGAFFLIYLSAAAQKSEASLKSQLEDLKTQNEELTRQNEYYRQTLDLLKPMGTDEKDGLRFEVVRVVGDRKNKVLKVYYLYTNLAEKPRKYFQPSSAYVVDPQGNQLSTYDVFASASQVMVENIQPGIPMKGVLVFSLSKAENMDFPMLKYLNISFLSMEMSKQMSVEIRNFNVAWL